MYETGSILGGKYRVEYEIARGGMGVVLAATHIKLGIKVALKFLREDLAKQQHVVDRFVREAQAAARLRSEHVCRVSDVGALDNGVPFIVMELLEGRDLATIVKTAPLDVATAVSCVLQACLAVAEAHALGIVHRDLKPANLYRTYRLDGTPLIKVLDFGVAKELASPEKHGITQTQNVMGSPGYMSPEQLRSSKSVDVRSDLWSLGIVLYEIVAGQRPWVADTISELTLKVASDPPTPMPSYIPKAYADVVMRCLEKDPARRYQTIAELASALAPLCPEAGPQLAGGVHRVLGSGPIELPASLQAQTQIVPAGAETPTTLRAATGAVDPPPLRPRAIPLVIAGLAAVAVVAVVLVVRGGGDDRPAAAIDPPPRAATVIDASPAPPVEIDASPATVADGAVVEVMPAPPPDAPADPPETRPAAKPAKRKPVVKKRKPTLEDIRDSRM